MSFPICDSRFGKRKNADDLEPSVLTLRSAINASKALHWVVLPHRSIPSKTINAPLGLAAEAVTPDADADADADPAVSEDVDTNDDILLTNVLLIQ